MKEASKLILIIPSHHTHGECPEPLSLLLSVERSLGHAPPPVHPWKWVPDSPSLIWPTPAPTAVSTHILGSLSAIVSHMSRLFYMRKKLFSHLGSNFSSISHFSPLETEQQESRGFQYSLPVVVVTDPMWFWKLCLQPTNHYRSPSLNSFLSG